MFRLAGRRGSTRWWLCDTSKCGYVAALASSSATIARSATAAPATTLESGSVLIDSAEFCKFPSGKLGSPLTGARSAWRSWWGRRFRLPIGFGRSWHAGGRLVRQAIVPAGGLSGRRPTDHSRSSHLFLRLRVCRHPAAKPEKFVAYQNGGLKGRLQARLPAARMAKVQWQSKPPAPPRCLAAWRESKGRY